MYTNNYISEEKLKAFVLPTNRYNILNDPNFSEIIDDFYLFKIEKEIKSFYYIRI